MRLRTIGLIGTLALGLFVVPLPVEAQALAKVHRIGLLTFHTRTHRAFREGLRELGYVEGKNIVIVLGSAAGKAERYPKLVAELVNLKVDVLVVVGLSAARAAINATTTIPIVFMISADPVETGLVRSLAHPGGNLTGVTDILPELAGKQLELLRETVPGVSRVAVLTHADAPARTSVVEKLRGAATAVGVTVYPLEVKGVPNFLPVFSEMARAGVDALIVFLGRRIIGFEYEIGRLARKHKLPTISNSIMWPRVGGLMSYAPQRFAMARRAAALVDKILKGTKPSDLPVERLIKFELVINLETAKQIGVTIPREVLFRADKVIK